MIGKILRWVCAAVCAAVGVKLVLTALKAGQPGAAISPETDEVLAGHLAMGSSALWVLAAVALLATVFLLSPDVVGRLAGAIGGFFTGFLFPDARSSKPELTYTLARFYVQEGRFADAVTEYRKIIRYYPDERDAYVELLSAAAQDGDTKAYNKFARILKRKFNCEIEVVYAEPAPEDDGAGGEMPKA